ncbi:MAG: hypothetical protein J6S12_04515 [Alphaproteobacteria bacterium]|nr:hypothetical protein [Alphaproteobacteria bacterium]
MSEHKVRIFQDFFDNAVRVKLTGGRSFVVAACLVALVFNTCTTNVNTREIKDIKRQELEQLKRQYVLDSLKFEYMKSQNMQKVP